MTDPLVEEVARAILDSGEGCLSGLVYVDPDKAAEAALSVVRKALETPTEEMVVAGDAKILDALQDHTFALRERTPAYECIVAALSASPLYRRG